MPKYYQVVRFGSPARDVARPQPYYTSERSAILAAQVQKGSGSCTTARVYECDSLALATSADISRLRSGERIVFEA